MENIEFESIGHSHDSNIDDIANASMENIEFESIGHSHDSNCDDIANASMEFELWKDTYIDSVDWSLESTSSLHDPTYYYIRYLDDGFEFRDEDSSDNFDILSIDSDDTDQLCQNWPQKCIDFHWIDAPKLDMKLGSMDVVNECLNYWCTKCGLTEWIEDENYLTLPIPNQWTKLVVDEMKSDTKTFDEPENELVSTFYNEIVCKDDHFIFMLDNEIHQQFCSWIDDVDDNSNNNNADDNHISQWLKFVNHTQQEQWTMSDEIHQFNRKGSKRFLEPRSGPGDPWYPHDDELWMDVFLDMIFQVSSMDEITRLIDRFIKKQQIQSVTFPDGWVPTSPFHLYNFFQPYASMNSVRSIHCKVMEKVGKHTFDLQERIYTYDSFLTDITNMIQTPVNRNSLLASVDEFLSFHKKNPIHINGVNGKFHSSQWRISKFGFFKFLEKIVFVMNGTNSQPANIWQTQMMTIGTFVQFHNGKC